MSLTDGLERLQALHDNGTLTDAEFTDAKAKVLAEAAPQAVMPDTRVQRDLRRLQLQNEILSLDQNWAVEREDYMLRGRYGSHVVPDASRGATGAVYSGVVFILIILMAVVIPWFRFAIAIAVLGMVACVWSGTHEIAKAKAYDEAYEQYQQKRQELTEQLAALG